MWQLSSYALLGSLGVALSATLSSAAVEMVKTLLDLSADVNDRGYDTADTPLLTAASFPSEHMGRLVELLLERNADPRLTNVDGNTAAQECNNVRRTMKLY